MRHDTQRMRRVPPLFTGQAAPERQDGFIDSNSVIVGFDLEVPVEGRRKTIHEGYVDQIHSLVLLVSRRPSIFMAHAEPRIVEPSMKARLISRFPCLFFDQRH